MTRVLFLVVCAVGLMVLVSPAMAQQHETGFLDRQVTVEGTAYRYQIFVPVSESRAMAQALKTLGSPVTYSELPGTNHNSWDAAYASPALTDWLFAQRRR